MSLLCTMCGGGDGAPQQAEHGSTGPGLMTTLPTLDPSSGGGDGIGTGLGSAATGTDDDDTGPGTGGDPEPPPPWSGDRTVAVHLFEWGWGSVGEECEQVLGPAGIKAVQVSPPHEHPAAVRGAPWWDRYQPVSYRVHSRGGDEDAFADMVARCAAVGVDVWVDAVINHMAWQHTGLGFAGTGYEEYSYADLYGPEHFHPCQTSIANWNDRAEVQTCELFGLPDLDTGHPHVQQAIAGYLADLGALGVRGFRIDAAKHIAADELAEILGAVPGRPYVFQEVIADATIAADEYFATGDVTEMGYGSSLSGVFRDGELAWLTDFGESWGLMPSDRAVVFVDNHDTQRGHGAGGGVITHAEPELYRLTATFMLAWPYGRPKLMSSYAFDDDDERPPTDDDGFILPVHDDAGACAAPWVCEHRWPEVRAMVAVRNRCHEAPVAAWWDDGADQIAFARDGCAFVAVNRDPDAVLSAVLPTTLPAGVYCDAWAGADGCAEVVVAADGTAALEVPPMTALAIHASDLSPRDTQTVDQ